MSTLAITPETRVGDLLEAWPEAEAILIGIAPKFKALRNPVLRRTVARVATLEQAARVADMPVNELVRALRAALGQEISPASVAPAEHRVGEDEMQGWVAGGAAVSFDADALLARGETPVGKVGAALAGLPGGGVVLIRSSFQVAPLIDAMRAKGHEVFTHRVADDAWEAWIRKG